LTVTVSLAGLSPEARGWGIYGDDNRQEVYDYPDRAIVALARSTVAIFKKSDLTSVGKLISVPTTSLQETLDVCPNERFKDQPAGAICSGFLVAPNKVVTAGHCVPSPADCEKLSFVFDYRMIDGGIAQTSFRPGQVYSCKKVLGQVYESLGRDFAVIELDRNVVDRSPVKLANNSNLSAGKDVFVIGHPAGLPVKITDGGTIRRVTDEHFVTNLDTYGGNSGSAVFNARTLEVEGILVRGARDFVKVGTCLVSYRFGNNGGGGEVVSKISQIHERGFEVDLEAVKYIWLKSDSTCNEFRGATFVREVADALCGSSVPVRYRWLPDNTCNLFHGARYIREVANALCGR
jgi:hypothetical protein